MFLANVAGHRGWPVIPTWLTTTTPVVTPVPPVVPVAPVPTVKVTAAVYVYEKDEGSVPAPVLAAISVLNGQGILATTFERNTVNGAGKTPTQYVAALEAAERTGLPCLIIMVGGTVTKIVKAPRTAAEVMEAVK